MREEALKEIFLRAVDSYNRYRKPEAEASLVKVRGNELVVDFEGSFCWTCGVYDFFEDLIYEVKNLHQVEMKVLSYKPIGFEKYRVRYVIDCIQP